MPTQKLSYILPQQRATVAWEVINTTIGVLTIWIHQRTTVNAGGVFLANHLAGTDNLTRTKRQNT